MPKINTKQLHRLSIKKLRLNLKKNSKCPYR
jgi:hypothetical protein